MSRQFRKYSDPELFVLLTTDEAEQAFSELYNRHSTMIYAYCVRVLGDREAAADAFQETFIRLLQSAKRLIELENVKGYILRIARNLCLNEKKRRSIAPDVEFDESMYNPGVSRKAERDEMLGLIEMAVELLPIDMREAFVLREYDGLSYNDIAQVLNVRLETAKVRVFRARQRLRDVLEPYMNDTNQDKAS